MKPQIQAPKKTVKKNQATKPASSKKVITKEPALKVVKPNIKKIVPTKPNTKPSAAKSTPKALAPSKTEKPKKPKLVRDSFAIPKLEYELIETIKLRMIKLGKPAKKSQVLRAGILAVSRLNDSALEKILAQVPSIKTGRPKNK
jgi:hypothetical protein